MLTDSIYEPWFKSFTRQIGELFQKPANLPPLPRFSDPKPGDIEIGPMLIDSTTEPWFHSIVRSGSRWSPCWVRFRPVSS